MHRSWHHLWSRRQDRRVCLSLLPFKSWPLPIVCCHVTSEDLKYFLVAITKCQLGFLYHLCLLECEVSSLNMPIALWCAMAQHHRWKHRCETVGRKGWFPPPVLPFGPGTLPIAYVLAHYLKGVSMRALRLYPPAGDSAPYKV